MMHPEHAIHISAALTRALDAITEVQRYMDEHVQDDLILCWDNGLGVGTNPEPQATLQSHIVTTAIEATGYSPRTIRNVAYPVVMNEHKDIASLQSRRVVINKGLNEAARLLDRLVKTP